MFRGPRAFTFLNFCMNTKPTLKIGSNAAVVGHVVEIAVLGNPVAVDDFFQVNVVFFTSYERKLTPIVNPITELKPSSMCMKKANWGESINPSAPKLLRALG